jgi:DeoR family transcriptional regulator of aga operon
MGTKRLRLREERRRETLKILEGQSRLTIEELVERFRVSAVTIRSDLEHLASAGLLVRTHGGAIPQLGPHKEYPLHFKKTLHHAEKVRIGRAAAQLIQPRQTVILDSGTTIAELARAIKKINTERVTIITHALNIAQELVNVPNISLIMIGGVLRNVSGSFVGPQAERMMSELHADHFFLAVDGFDIQSGPSTPDLLEAQLNSVMMRTAKEVTVVTDATKFARRSLSVIGDTRKVHRVITDDHVSEEIVCQLRKMGIEVLIV